MQISSRKVCALGIFLFLLTLALPLTAQNRVIQGTITDDKGQPVVGAQVSIQSLDSKMRQYNVKTKKKGDFVYMGIPAGDYRVVVRAAGFAPNFRQPIRPSIQEPSVVDMTLTPGSDQKLPFEMSAEEVNAIQKEVEKAEKRKQVSAEVQKLFDEGLGLAAQGKHQEAIEVYKKALDQDPEQSNIMGNMADSYSKLGNNEEAVVIYQKAIAVNPKDAALYTNLGVILSKLGKEAESQAAFKKAAEVNPGASAQNFYNIGATLVNSGKSQEAAESFKKAIEADPNFAEAYYQLGMCLSGKAETMPDAIKALEKYIQIGQKADQIEVAKQIIAALQQSLKK